MIRHANSGDQAFIAATWTRSLCSTHRVPGVSSRGHARQRHVGSAMWVKVSQQVDAVMDRPDSRAIVTCHPINRDRIIGWALYVEGPSVPTVHYLYVRDHDDAGESLRNRGFAAAMLERIGVSHHAPVVCTSLGPSSKAMRSRYKAAVHLPLEEFLRP